MAFSLVHSGIYGTWSGTSSGSLALGFSPATSNVLFAVRGYWQQVGSGADAAGHGTAITQTNVTWSQLTSIENYSPGSNRWQRIELWMGTASDTPGTNITFGSSTSGPRKNAIVTEYSGFIGSPFLVDSDSLYSTSNPYSLTGVSAYTGNLLLAVAQETGINFAAGISTSGYVLANQVGFDSLDGTTELHYATAGADGTQTLAGTWTDSGGSKVLLLHAAVSGIPPPAKASVPTPSDTSTGALLSPTLSWTGGAGASGYNVYLDTSNPPTTLRGSPTSPTLGVANLDLNTTYYWRVDTTWAGSPVTGDVWSFTTKTGRASAPSPSDDGIATDEPVTLSWTGDSEAVDYSVYIGKVSPPATLLGTTAATSISSGALDHLSEYFWKVNANYVSGNVVGDEWSFDVTITPDKPVLPVPANDSELVALSTNLRWTGDTEDVTSYKTYFGTNRSSLPLVDSPLGQASPTGTLTHGQRYYWRVDSLYPLGTVTGDTWSFRCWNLTWPVVLEVIRAWAQNHSGLAANRVIWAHQDAPRPAYPYGMLQVLNDSTRGGLVSQTAVSAPSVAAVDDPEDPTYRPALAAVDEIQRLVGVQHTLTVSFQVYCQTTTPSAHAKQYLEAAQVGLVKPSQMETFSLARVAPVRAEPIQDLSALGSGEMLSRANMDVTFAFVLNTADTALSYIELLTDTTLALEGGVSGTITETFDIDMT